MGQNVFISQNKTWSCSTADVEQWLKENNIPPANATAIIRENNKKSRVN